MTAEEALKELAQLFPEPEYTSEVVIATDGSHEIQVFCNHALDCSNVLYVDGPDLDKCMAEARERAEEAKRLSVEIGGRR